MITASNPWTNPSPDLPMPPPSLPSRLWLCEACGGFWHRLDQTWSYDRLNTLTRIFHGAQEWTCGMCEGVWQTMPEPMKRRRGCMGWKTLDDGPWWFIGGKISHQPDGTTQTRMVDWPGLGPNPAVVTIPDSPYLESPQNSGHPDWRDPAHSNARPQEGKPNPATGRGRHPPLQPGTSEGARPMADLADMQAIGPVPSPPAVPMASISLHSSPCASPKPRTNKNPLDSAAIAAQYPHPGTRQPPMLLSERFEGPCPLSRTLMPTEPLNIDVYPGKKKDTRTPKEPLSERFKGKRSKRDLPLTIGLHITASSFESGEHKRAVKFTPERSKEHLN